MTLKNVISLAALGIVSGCAPSAMAQTNTPTQQTPAVVAPKTPVPGQIVVQDANTVLAKGDLIGQTVYAPDKAKIGSISDLILSKDGMTVEGYVIGVGGFLGLGEKSVALKMDKLKINKTADGTMELSMDMTKDEPGNVPSFKSQRDVAAEKAAEQRPAAPAQRQAPKN